MTYDEKAREIGTHIMREYHKTRMTPYNLPEAIATALRTARQEGIEEAAQKLEALGFNAAAIRALKEQP
jgi:hypothetical protein